MASTSRAKTPEPWRTAGSIFHGASQGDAVFLTDGGTVSNASSGVIYGEHTAVYIEGGPGTVINDGLITGHTAYGVDLKHGGIDRVNAGMLAGSGARMA